MVLLRLQTAKLQVVERAVLDLIAAGLVQIEADLTVLPVAQVDWSMRPAHPVRAVRLRMPAKEARRLSS